MVDHDKSLFLESLSSDGKIIDKDLIMMMEREVLDKNPMVKFDDIAELNDAKNILK